MSSSQHWWLPSEDQPRRDDSEVRRMPTGSEGKGEPEEYADRIRQLVADARAVLQRVRDRLQPRGAERENLAEVLEMLTQIEREALTGLEEASGRNGREFQLPPQGVPLETVERTLVEQALERAGGNRTRAGELLGLTRDQVRYRIDKFGLDGGEHH